MKTKDATLASQEAFLAVYSKMGTILDAAKAADVGRRTVYDWREQDMLGFRERFTMAQHNFREHLEQIAISRISRQSEQAHPLLLITMLNASWPEKYRQSITTSDEIPKEWLVELRKLGKAARATDHGGSDGASDVVSEAEQVVKDKAR